MDHICTCKEDLQIPCWSCHRCLPLVNNVPSCTFYLHTKAPTPQLPCPWFRFIFLNLWRKMDWARCCFICLVVTKWMFPNVIVSTSCILQSSRVWFTTNYGDTAVLSKWVCIYWISWVLINANLLSLLCTIAYFSVDHRLVVVLKQHTTICVDLH